MILFMLTAFDIPLTGIDYDPVTLLISLLLPMLFPWRQRLPGHPQRADAFAGRADERRPGEGQVNLLERSLKLDRLEFHDQVQIREQLRSLSRLAFLLAGCAIATMLLLYGFTIKSSLDYLEHHQPDRHVPLPVRVHVQKPALRAAAGRR